MVVSADATGSVCLARARTKEPASPCKYLGADIITRADAGHRANPRLVNALPVRKPVRSPVAWCIIMIHDRAGENRLLVY